MLMIIDIDDTIADGSRRAQAAGAEPNRLKDVAAYEKWRDTINSGIEHDLPVSGLCELAHALADSGNHVAYVTARGSNLREATREWLSKHGFPDLMLYMRAASDFRPTAEYKEWVINKLLTAEHEPVVVIDDDVKGELEAVCRRRGWTLLRAGFGRAK